MDRLPIKLSSCTSQTFIGKLQHGRGRGKKKKEETVKEGQESELTVVQLTVTSFLKKSYSSDTRMAHTCTVTQNMNTRNVPKND